MRLSLELVVIAIVILVVALVVLTIFSSIIPRFSSLADFRNYCKSIGKSSCESGVGEPINWRNNENVAGTVTTCQQAIGTFSSCCSTSGGAPAWIC